MSRKFESVFHHYGDPVKLVQASWYIAKDIGSSLKKPESSVYHCRFSVKQE